MIFARDKGRMCNNMLQYAHVYAWGREHGRRTVSMRFCYKYPYFAISSTRGHNFLTYAAAKLAAGLGLLPVVSFNTPGEDTAAKERLMLSRRNVVVEGWYARFYDLFLKYKPDIMRLFAFRPEILNKVSAFAGEAARGCDLRLGLHVRRGDYKTWHGGQYYYSDAEYAAMAARFAAISSGRRVCVFVCGNDPQLDRSAYLNGCGAAKVVFACGNAAEDLCLLSLCDAIIGPPSTFSLVAAMYRDTPLCWAYDARQDMTPDSFKRFDYLFRHIE